MAGILTVTPNAALDLWTRIEHLRSGPKLRAAVPRFYAGGGGINVSRVLHRLGGETLALFAGGGWSGDEIAAAIAREDVPCQRVITNGTTRQNVNLCESHTDKVFRIVMPGPKLTESELDDILDQAADLASHMPVVVGSGSLPPETRTSFWGELAACVKRAGSRFVLDSASAVGAAMEEGVWLLRQNKDEIVETAARELDWPGGVADWASLQINAGACDIAVITHGAEGALMVKRDMRLRIAPPEVPVNSAIGAGDSFVAGLCWSLVHDEPAEDALRLAVATAAATLLTPGTELCRKEDVEQLLSKCTAPVRL